MHTKRFGYTLAEVMIVIAIIGLILATLTPKVRTIREGSNLRAAKDGIAMALGTARAAAIQKGGSAKFHLSTADSSIMVDAISNGTTVTIMPKRTIGQMYGTGFVVDRAGAASPADTVITFDSRGFGTSTTASAVAYVVTLGTKKDSVCVSKLGLIKKTGC